jgi:hypothetical protein
MTEYWREAVDIAFRDEGITATDEQIDNVAGAIESSHENYGMAHGYDAIPNPAEAVESALVASLKSEIKRLEEEIIIYRRSVAFRRGVRVDDVYTQSGKVFFS